MNDVISVLETLRIPHRLSGEHSSSGWVQIDCAFCGSGEGAFHMGINLSFPRANCWKCGKQSLAKTLQLHSFLSYEECKKLVADMPRDRSFDELVLPQEVILPKGIKPMVKQHKRYLRSRGLDADQMEKLWNLQGFDFLDLKYKWRLFIPIEYRTKVVSFTTRTISQTATDRRYKACPRAHEAIRHQSLLYGLDYVRHRAIVVEGPSDVWKVGPGAVGTFGIDYTAEQVVLLSKIPIRYICFDVSAESAANRLAEELSYYEGETHVIQLEDSEDPGSASPREIRQLRKLIE